MAPNQFFGELGLLGNHKRTATVVAATPMRLVVIPEMKRRTKIILAVVVVAVGAVIPTAAAIDLEAKLRGVDDLVQGTVVLAIALTPVVVALALVYRRRVARLAAAAGLVLWGLFIVATEHVQWGLAGFGGADLLTHTGFHFQMLAAFGLAALVLVGVVLTPLIRRGNAAGWLGLLILAAIGVGAELTTAAATTPHGVPPRFWIAGLFLWGYPVAWGAALALSFRPIFRPEGRPTARATDNAQF